MAVSSLLTRVFVGFHVLSLVFFTSFFLLDKKRSELGWFKDTCARLLLDPLHWRLYSRPESAGSRAGTRGEESLNNVSPLPSRHALHAVDSAIPSNLYPARNGSYGIEMATPTLLRAPISPYSQRFLHGQSASVTTLGSVDWRQPLLSQESAAREQDQMHSSRPRLHVDGERRASFLDDLTTYRAWLLMISS